MIKTDRIRSYQGQKLDISGRRNNIWEGAEVRISEDKGIQCEGSKQGRWEGEVSGGWN